MFQKFSCVWMACSLALSSNSQIPPTSYSEWLKGLAIANMDHCLVWTSESPFLLLTSSLQAVTGGISHISSHGCARANGLFAPFQPTHQLRQCLSPLLVTFSLLAPNGVKPYRNHYSFSHRRHTYTTTFEDVGRCILVNKEYQRVPNLHVGIFRA